MSAVDNWRQMILAEHAQTDRIRGPRPTDHWTQLARNFKDDPHRTGDEMVDKLQGAHQAQGDADRRRSGGRQAGVAPGAELQLGLRRRAIAQHVLGAAGDR